MPSFDFSKLPAVHTLAEQAGLEDLPRNAVVAAARALIDAQRRAIVAGGALDNAAELFSIVALRAEVGRQAAAPLQRVINATGVVLHTNLGRAPLGQAAIAAVADVAGGYCNLEFDLVAGKRGSRHVHVAALLRELTGAQAGIVVNNNAAATVLGIAAIAAGREVIVSRGELVEIGGAFRLPEICAMAGARLVAVGTTNKTRIDDYRRAIGPGTALLLKVHQSNFEQRGFVEAVELSELAALGKATQIATMIDLGSGCFADAATLRSCGLPAEPSVAQVAALVDAVSFSGDKLLGGPQAGMLVGRSDIIERARTHPWMRALRPDKMTLAALWATLQALRTEGTAALPVWNMLKASTDELTSRGQRALALLVLEPAVPAGVTVEVWPSHATVGGGTMPTSQLPSMALRVVGDEARVARIAALLRAGRPAVLGRLADAALWLDLRTVADAEVPLLVAALAAACHGA
ncbi:MAG: L-seryl-tRNA(Sec) selenium transferase [Kofleriaceae bacterium]|nr:L-seryl-tRNA(Sec) selenium transferase [Kofleriaceae bacterium]